MLPLRKSACRAVCHYVTLPIAKFGLPLALLYPFKSAVKVPLTGLAPTVTRISRPNSGALASFLPRSSFSSWNLSFLQLPSPPSIPMSATTPSAQPVRLESVSKHPHSPVTTLLQDAPVWNMVDHLLLLLGKVPLTWVPNLYRCDGSYSAFRSAFLFASSRCLGTALWLGAFPLLSLFRWKL